MKRLNVSIEVNGKQHHVGHITGTSYEDAQFSYSRDYLSMKDIVPISVHLPLQKEAFSAMETEAFFEGLLPEGFSRRAVANWAKTDEKDYLHILQKLGQECLGALLVLEEDSEMPAGSYEKLSIERVKELAAEGASKSTQLLLETHLSLTGASGKVGLYYDKESGDWYLPLGNAASTHIVKQSHIRLDQIVLNEQLCVRTAHYIGIDVPESFIIDMKAGEDADVLYATERYDRQLSKKRTEDGLLIPMRLHQEDFAQALGISAANKYETKKEGYLRWMFELLRKNSSNPLEDQMKLWDIIVYNYLIGNTDCHLKNYSLLYSPSMQGIRLAPAYDIICTRAYRSSKDMSFYIGDEINIEKIQRKHFMDAAAEVGLGKKIAMKHFDSLAGNFERALKQAVTEVKDKGFPRAEAFGERILAGCGYRNL